jgi:hypothetical protein
MDVFSTELGIRLRFVKTLEFLGEGGLNSTPPLPPFGVPLFYSYIRKISAYFVDCVCVCVCPALCLSPALLNTVTARLLNAVSEEK